MSDHSIRAYKELCNGVGETCEGAIFQAVPVKAREKKSASTEGPMISVNECKISLGNKILLTFNSR